MRNVIAHSILVQSEFCYCFYFCFFFLGGGGAYFPHLSDVWMYIDIKSHHQILLNYYKIYLTSVT